MFPCKPNILTGSEVGDRHNRRMNVQVYSPKEEQALPPNYEQLLNRTEHQQRQKNVCMWMKEMLTSYINLCICLQKQTIKK